MHPAGLYADKPLLSSFVHVRRVGRQTTSTLTITATYSDNSVSKLLLNYLQTVLLGKMLQTVLLGKMLRTVLLGKMLWTVLLDKMLQKYM